MTKGHFIVFLGLILSVLGYGQSDGLQDSTLVGQFEWLKSTSDNYEDNGGRIYEVIRLININAVQKNLIDSLQEYKSQINSYKNAIAEYENTINNLKSEVDKADMQLVSTNEEKDTITFFGNNIQKSTYKAVVWIGVLLLLLLSAYYLVRYYRSITITEQSKLALSELENQFEQYKRNALEREQKLNRALHDERKKNQK